MTKHRPNGWKVAGLALAMLAGLGCETLAQDGGSSATTSKTQPSAATVRAMKSQGPFSKTGFVTKEVDGRLWVWRVEDEGLADFMAGKEPAKNVTKPRSGPAGMTLRGPDMDTLNAFIAAKDGFHTEIVDGRIWVFAPGSAGLAEFRKSGEPAKSVTRVAAGPGRMTVRSDDMEVIQQYIYSRPGFVVRVVDERLWVWRRDGEGVTDFLAGKEPAKSVTKPAAGPGRITVRGPDMDTVNAWIAARTGFFTEIVDGRIWVFVEGSKELAEFQARGEPAKSVTKPRAGPGGMTVRGPDLDTINAYVASSY